MTAIDELAELRKQVQSLMDANAELHGDYLVAVKERDELREQVGMFEATTKHQDGLLVTMKSEYDKLMGQGEAVGVLSAWCGGESFSRNANSPPLGVGNHDLYTHPAPAVDDGVPNMFWDDGAPEESFAEDPCSFADAVSDDMTDYDDVFIVDVRCAKSLPNRQMKVWLEADGSGGHDVKWEWVE